MLCRLSPLRRNALLLNGLVAFVTGGMGSLPATAQLTVSLADLCSAYPQNSRCLRVQQGLPSVETGVELPPEDSCIPLAIVGSDQTEIRKSVNSTFGYAPFFRWFAPSSWDTDFIVPPESSFSQFIAVLNSETSGEYDARMFLKYPDRSSDQVHKISGIPLFERQQHSFDGLPRSGETPSQVNVSIGGSSGGGFGNIYRLRVLGCE